MLGVSIPQWFCAFPRRGNCSLKAIIEYFIIHTFIVFPNCVVVLFCSPSYTYTFTRGPSIFIHTLVFIFIYNLSLHNCCITGKCQGFGWYPHCYVYLHNQLSIIGVLIIRNVFCIMYKLLCVHMRLIISPSTTHSSNYQSGQVLPV